VNDLDFKREQSALRVKCRAPSFVGIELFSTLNTHHYITHALSLVDRAAAVSGEVGAAVSGEIGRRGRGGATRATAGGWRRGGDGRGRAEERRRGRIGRRGRRKLVAADGGGTSEPARDGGRSRGGPGGRRRRRFGAIQPPAELGGRRLVARKTVERQLSSWRAVAFLQLL
jgi:hypothetical protein